MNHGWSETSSDYGDEVSGGLHTGGQFDGGQSTNDFTVAALSLEAAPTLLKMRCPNCQKNYSVEESWVHAAPLNSQRAFMTPLRFECFSCKSRFEAIRPPAQGAAVLETNLIPVSHPNGAPLSAPARTPERRSPFPNSIDTPRGERSALAKVPLIAQTLKCPKCGVRTNGLATECSSCGVVFSRYKPIPDGAVGEIRLDGRRDISDLWETIIANYEDETRHERFVAVCADAQCLAYAAQKYAGILSVSPQEEIARRMKKRIVALSSFPFESKGSSGAYTFRVPKFVDLILVLGAATATIGFLIPGMKNVAGIGIAAIALAIGVRFFLRPRQT